MSLPTAPTNLTFDKPEVNKVKMSWDQPNIVSTTHSVEYDIEVGLLLKFYLILEVMSHKVCLFIFVSAEN